ncbi:MULTISPECIES: DUF485 domain-containing protein [Pandoraea]|uniref:DUF485 domain-containing protein n=1 Tax=Pandoraea TaxID=93217 RepID=UPI001F5CA315|nr:MULTISPECIES: DUF485 domain-containing protein [Pandoraea]
MQLVRRKNRISAISAAVIVILFGGFVAMFTFGRDILAQPFIPGVPWSAVAEPLLIVASLLISVGYVLAIGRIERAEHVRGEA